MINHLVELKRLLKCILAILPKSESTLIWIVHLLHKPKGEQRMRG